jgi:hypothetical protein
VSRHSKAGKWSLPGKNHLTDLVIEILGPPFRYQFSLKLPAEE